MITSRRMWLKNDQQPLKKKGNGRAIHCCDWVTETIGRFALFPQSRLPSKNKSPWQRGSSPQKPARSSTLGKNHDAWQDFRQLMDQTKVAVDIFEYTHPDIKSGIWIFDCSSAHEGLASDALNINNMNVHPGGTTARAMRSTIIPHSNPPPNSGRPDTRGRPQDMVFPPDHPNEKLRGVSQRE